MTPQPLEQFPYSHAEKAKAASKTSTRHCTNCSRVVQSRHYQRHYEYCMRAELDVPHLIAHREHKMCCLCGVRIVPVAISHLPCFNCERKDDIFDELDKILKHGKYKPVAVDDSLTKREDNDENTDD